MKKQKLPNPRDARLAKGLQWRQLAAAAQIGLATISRCERTRQYPTNVHTRKAYLSALGLSEAG